MTPIWDFDNKTYSYEDSIMLMESYVEQIISNNLDDKIWVLELLDTYTAGSSALPNEFINNESSIPTIKTNRGGKWTYHGKGQRIIYPMINLSASKDIKSYIFKLEEWIILVLRDLNIDAFRKKDMIGVWVVDNNIDSKICAIGIRVKKWIAYHGLALNVNTVLSKFNNIIPCGISGFSVSSIYNFVNNITYTNLDKIMFNNFYKVFK